MPPLPKQRPPEQAAQAHIQEAFKDLQGGRHHKPLGQPLPVLRHPHGTEVLPGVQGEVLVFQFSRWSVGSFKSWIIIAENLKTF